MVTRDRGRVDVTDSREPVPDGFAFAIGERCAFDLRRRRRHAPGKMLRKCIRPWVCLRAFGAEAAGTWALYTGWNGQWRHDSPCVAKFTGDSPPIFAVCFICFLYQSG